MGLVEGNEPVTDNAWETVTRGGEAAIKRWIGSQMVGRTCAVVLIGAETSRRPWVKYEIKKAWTDGKGVVGIYIHNLKGRLGEQSRKGADPFYHLYINGHRASEIIQSYDPPYRSSSYVYSFISANMASWVEEAISIRNQYRRA